jgi:hypothetical protein
MIRDQADYRAHVFTSSGTFTVTNWFASESSVDYLVVAGGGGGLEKVVVVLEVLEQELEFL